MTDGDPGPAQLDAGEYFGDWGAELERCARQHWWAQGMDQHGTPMAVVLAWDANRATLTDRRLSPRSFADDMVANGLSPATARQVAPLFSRHGDEHRHLRAVLSKAFTPKSVEQLRPATRAIAERLADGIADAGGSCDVVAAFACRCRRRCSRSSSASRSRTATGWLAGPQPSPSPSTRRCRASTWRWSSRRPPRCGPTATSASRSRRDDPGDDLVTRLLEAEVDGQRLSDDDVIAMITGFVFAGAETTRRQLTAAVQLLADHPGTGSAWPPSRT